MHTHSASCTPPQVLSRRALWFFFAASYILSALLLTLSGRYSLCYTEQWGTFFLEPVWLHDTLLSIGGAAELAGAFIVQFFITPAVSILLTALLMATMSVLTALAARTGKALLPLALLPALAEMLLMHNVNHHFSGSMALLFVLVALVVRREDARCRMVFDMLAGALLFLLIGPCALLYAAIVLVQACFQSPRKAMAALPAVAIVVLLAFACLWTGQTASLRHVLCPDGYYTLRLQSGAVVWWPWALLVAVVILSAACRRIVRSSRCTLPFILSAIAAVAFGAVGTVSMVDDSNEFFKKLSVLTRHERYDEVVNSCSRHHMNNLLFQNYRHLALAEKGELAERLHEVPVSGLGSIFVGSDKSPYVSALLSDVYWSMGHIGFAQRYAFEANESLGNHSPLLLQRLVQTNIASGYDLTARKYLRLLRHTLFYRRWAAHYERYLDGVEADSMMDVKRACLFADNRFCGIRGLDNDLEEIVRTNPAHQQTAQYLTAINDILGKKKASLPPSRSEAPLLWRDKPRIVASNSDIQSLLPQGGGAWIGAPSAGSSAQLPSHHTTVIPCNIAPLNFHLDAPDAAVTLKGMNHELKAHVRKGDVTFPLRKWHALLAAETGNDLTLTVNGEPRATLHVSPDSIDPYIAYRLIEPGYEIWNEMGIYQRCLENYDERAILTNRLTHYGCMNCHSFNQRNPEEMLFHLRVECGGTYLVKQGDIKKMDTKTPETLSALVYPQWHPDGRHIAFSVNDTKQLFHTTHANRVEVFDYASDVVVLDKETDEIISSPLLMSTGAFETFPTFSPDGRTLFFCSADSVPMPEAYDQVRYSLCRISFDPDTHTFGTTVDTLYNARTEGRSVSFPRLSPDGQHVMLTLSSYGNFSIWHKDADLYLVRTDGTGLHALDELNSCDVESYHSWSSNGRWVIFSSRRDDKLYTRLYIAHIEADGTVSAPFALPQKYESHDAGLMKSYNIPEFLTSPVSTPARRLSQAAQSDSARKLTFRKAQ